MLLKVEQMEASRREEEGDTLGEDGEGEEGEDAKEEQDEEEESEEEGEKNEEEKDGEESEGEKDEDEDEKGQAGVEEDEEDDNNGDNQKRNPWSHHIDRKCMVPSGCRGYVGPNLKRHLQNVHYQKGHITEQDVDKYFALGLDPKKTRGPKRTARGGKTIKGRWKHWYPEKACNYFGCYLPEHLQNKHRMKPGSAVYKLSLKVARRYQGLEGELCSIEPVSQPSIPSPDSTTTKDKKVSPSSVPSHLPLPELPIVEEVTMQSASDEEAIDELDIVPPSPAAKSKPPNDNVSDDDDDTVHCMQEDFFKDPNSRTDRHMWLIGFYKYLFTPAAGFHKERNRLQHASQVRTILEEIEPKGDDITIIADEEGNKVWLDWVMPNLTKKAGGTLKSYLGSLQKFLEYVTKKGLVLKTTDSSKSCSTL